MNKKHRNLPLMIIPIVCAAALLILSIVLIKSFITPRRVYRYPEDCLVCLDAGHGGSDVGAVGENDRYEKDDNLRLTMRVGEILGNMGIRVCFTRETDEYVTLKDRAKFANRQGAGMFVSIHRNSAEPDARGIEAWIESTDPKPDRALADKLLDEVEKAGFGKNRGVHTGFRGKATSDYAVNSRTNMPSVLLEVGFISNEEDNMLFDENFDRCALAIAGAIYKVIND